MTAAALLRIRTMNRTRAERERMKKNYTYLLRCADGTLYCGWTNDPEKRLAAHNAGTASKYTASRRPVEFAYLEEHETKQDAMKREAAIKRMSRKKKLQMIADRAKE